MTPRRWVLLAALVLPACSITTHVDPLPDARIDAVCIKENRAS